MPAPLLFSPLAAQELAELGGGGHETICASVQEHIADTYLGHGGSQGALPRPGGSKSTEDDGTVESSRGRSSRGQGALAGARAAGDVESVTSGRQGGRRGPWTADSEGGVWTSPPPLRPPSVAAKGYKKGKRRGDVQGKSGAGRNNPSRGDDFEGVGKGGGSHPGSVRLGGGGGGDGVATSGSAGGYAEMDKNVEREREENLDKAQVSLIAIVLRESRLGLQLLILYGWRRRGCYCGVVLQVHASSKIIGLYFELCTSCRIKFAQSASGLAYGQ